MSGTAYALVRALLLALAFVLAFVLGPGLAGAQTAASEAGVKAAYLFKFLAYVEWPTTALPVAGAPFVIGVVEAEAVHEDLLLAVAERQVSGHPVVVRKLLRDDNLDGVHALFIGRGAARARWLERVKGRPLLLVTDAAQGLESGSMINFVTADGRVRFEASQAAAEGAGLRLSARLLAVAERVVLR